jgi:predicted homoserine dehydrogenase-like protein
LADASRDRQHQRVAGPYRNPTTQKGFAEKWGQNPAMVTSFCRWFKISFEQSIACRDRFKVMKRGMSRGMDYKAMS